MKNVSILLKKFLCMGMGICLCLMIVITPVSASDYTDSAYVNEWEVEILPEEALLKQETIVERAVAPRFVNDIRYRKKNVKSSTEWSGYKRVSDNLATTGKGGSLCSNKSVSFDAVVSGGTSGLGISLGPAVSSEIGYTLNVGANKRVYMGYRVFYKVEKGTRETYDVTNGKVVSVNEYVVKKPQYGEYTLINY